MNKRIRLIYQQLYREVSAIGRDKSGRFVGYRFDPVRKIVEDAAAQASNLFNKELRPDAKMLLLMNFGNLVVAPLTIAGRVTPEQIHAAVSRDITSLVAHAAEVTNGREISAHNVIDVFVRTVAAAERFKVSAMGVGDHHVDT